MRVWTCAAAMLLIGAADSAVAMSFFGGGASSCAKGMLWPYVRNPGDCLTDAEIQAGQRGVYNGAVNTNPNIGAMAPPPPAVVPTPGGVVSSPDFAAPAAAPAFAPAPAIAGPGYAVAPAYASPPPAIYAAGQAPPPGDPNVRTVTSFSCTKGALWPFTRKPGDCLTTSEKKAGRTGVYGGGSGLTVTQVSAVSGQPVVMQPSLPTQPGATAVTVDSYGQPIAVAQPVAVPSCTKGTLWPFVKKPGDCQTSSEQKKSK